MPQIDRTRDLIIYQKGDTFTVSLSPTLATSEWSGGQGVSWFDTGRDEFTVSASDGKAHGFLLWGSDEDSDRYTAMTRYQPNYRFAVMGFGGWIVSTRAFEKHTWASRQVSSSVPLTYGENDLVYFSLRGLPTKEDEWTLSGDPRAPNGNVVGVVVQAPSPKTNGYLTLQLRL